MGGVGEFLLLDKGVVVEPVEQLRAVGADHLGLRIMDVGVDEARGHDAAGMIVDDRAARRAGENVARLADRLDQSARDKNGAVVDDRMGRRPACCGIVGERQNAAANDSAFAVKAECPSVEAPRSHRFQ